MAKALTVNVVKRSINANRFLLMVSFSGTGDASGGLATGQVDLAPFIPIGAKLVLEEWQALNDASSEFDLVFDNYNFEFGFTPYLACTNGANSMTSITGMAIAFGDNSYRGHNVKLPYFFGKMLGTQATLTGSFSNVDSKTYKFYSKWNVYN